MSTFEKALGFFLTDPPPKQARYRDAETVLVGIGYRLVRTQGSHHHFTNVNGQRITMAVHNGKIEAATVKDVSRAIRRWNSE